MHITLLNDFRFSQYHVQDDGGWCAGISIAIITHLTENLPLGQAVPTPQEAFDQTKEYIGILKGSYNKVTGQTRPGAQGYRREVRRAQAPYNFGGGSPPGAWIYNFTAPGMAFLKIIVRNQTASNYGGAFQSSFAIGSNANHAGIAVWDVGTTIFLFDPNAGGILFQRGTGNQATTFLQGVDLASELIYKKYDRMRGERSAQLESARVLDPASLPFGRV